MEQIIRAIICAVVGIVTFVVLTNLGSGTTVEMTSDSNSATMVTTDYFGNKKTCRTTMFYGTTKTSCD